MNSFLQFLVFVVILSSLLEVTLQEGAECNEDWHCQDDFRCINNICVGDNGNPVDPDNPELDPCSLKTCGPGAECRVSEWSQDATCHCKEWLVPNPGGDPETSGCSEPQCSSVQDCSRGYQCLGLKCVQDPTESDPCQPNPCGPGANCVQFKTSFFCECPTGLTFRKDFKDGCGPTCSRDLDCSIGSRCLYQVCSAKEDDRKGGGPCQDRDVCGPGSKCIPTSLDNHFCRCDPGLVPGFRPENGCVPRCSGDRDCKPGFQCDRIRCVRRTSFVTTTKKPERFNAGK